MVESGQVYVDLDPRELKRQRTVRVFTVAGDFAYCRSSSGRETRIHLRRLSNPRHFRLVDPPESSS